MRRRSRTSTGRALRRCLLMVLQGKRSWIVIGGPRGLLCCELQVELRVNLQIAQRWSYCVFGDRSRDVVLGVNLLESAKVSICKIYHLSSLYWREFQFPIFRMDRLQCTAKKVRQPQIFNIHTVLALDQIVRSKLQNPLRQISCLRRPLNAVIYTHNLELPSWRWCSDLATFTAGAIKSD